MSTESEQLIETLINLELSCKREHNLRVESEALLEGLRGITDAKETKTLFYALVKVLHSVIEFEDAFILQGQDNGEMLSIVSTSENLSGSRWKTLSVFNRVLSGKPIAVFDVDQIPEWAQQPNTVRKNIKSALHIGLQGGSQTAILIVTHSNQKQFGPVHVKQAERFAPLASQAILTLDLQRVIIQRDRFFELSMDLMAIVSFDGYFKQLNTAWKNFLGHNEKELIIHPIFEFTHNDDRKVLLEAMEQIKKTGKKVLIELRFSSHDGNYRWLSCNLAAYPEEQLCYVSARDVTTRVAAEQKLAYDVHHDPLTGLFNRTEFSDRLKVALAYSARQTLFHFAVFYLDLDKFKMINDTLGHNIGDKLLKEVSRRLLASVREVDIVARIGGDEFVILLTDLKPSDYAEIVAKRIHRQLADPINIQDNKIITSASIGITLSSFGYKNITEILRDADTAMYKAKSEGRSRHVVFNREMDKPDK